MHSRENYPNVERVETKKTQRFQEKQTRKMGHQTQQSHNNISTPMGPIQWRR